MNEMPNDTKLTKAQIITAYNAIVAKLKSTNAETMNVSAEIQNKHNEKIFAAAQAATIDNTMEKMLASLVSFREIAEQKFEVLASVEAAIQLKNKELEDLFGIEKEALSLAAFVDTRKIMKQQLEEEYASRKKLIESELDALKTSLKSELDVLVAERKTFESEFATFKRNSEQELATYKLRTKEEFEYQHARDVKEAQDTLQDKLNNMTASFENNRKAKLQLLEEKEKEIKEREDRVNASLSSFADMQRQIEEMPSVLEAKVQQKQAVILKSLTEKFDSDKRLFIAENTAIIKVMEAQITTLEQSNSELVSANKQLTDKLTAAYAEIKEMANKAFDSASGKKELDSIMKFAEQQNQKNTNK